MLQWKIFMVMALIGHILCGISDGFLTYAPNGKVDLTNFKDYEKSKVAFHGMPLKNLSVAMLLGVCAVFRNILSDHADSNTCHVYQSCIASSVLLSG